MSPAQGPLTGGTPVTIAGANLAVSQQPFCNFGGNISPGTLVKLSRKQLKEHCHECTTGEVELGDGVVANKTKCGSTKCSSDAIAAQQYRIICTSPPSQSAGSVVLSVAFGSSTAFTPIPNADFTYHGPVQ